MSYIFISLLDLLFFVLYLGQFAEVVELPRLDVLHDCAVVEVLEALLHSNDLYVEEKALSFAIEAQVLKRD